MKNSLRSSLVLPLLLAGAGVNAQQVYDYTGMGSSTNWTSTASWIVEPFPMFPNSPDALVRFGALQNRDADRVNMLFSSTALNPPAQLTVGAILFLPELDPLLDSFLVRNFSTTVFGNLHIHSLPYQIEGQGVDLLIANLGTRIRTAFLTSNFNYDIILHNSGVIHAAGHPDDPTLVDARLEIANAITHNGEPKSIIKTGPGILRFAHPSGGRFNTYAGGFTLDGGIVEWTQSGSRNANPFGGFDAPLVLKKGTLRSTSATSGRTLIGQIVLDGGASFGWDGEGFNASITLNSYSGAHRSTIVSDSTLSIHNRVAWNQSIDGTGNLIKDGLGTLVLTSFSQSTFAGNFTIAAGQLQMTGATLAASPLTIQSGARLEGYGEANAGLVVESGATLHVGIPLVPGDPLAEPPVPDTPAVRGTVKSTALTMFAGTVVELGFDSSTAGGYDQLVATGPVSLGGAELVLELTATPPADSTFVLLDNQSGSPVSGQFSYEGHLLTEGTVFAVISGNHSFEAEITYNYNQGGYSRSVALIPPGSGGGATGYEGWREARFGNTTDPAGDPLAKPVGQAVANLLLYALGLDLAVDPAAGLPVAVGEQAIRFTRRSDLAVRLVVEGISGNPSGTWQTLATLEAGASTWSGSANVAEEAAGTDLVQVTATDTVGSTTGVRLLRVRAVLP